MMSDNDAVEVMSRVKSAALPLFHEWAVNIGIVPISEKLGGNYSDTLMALFEACYTSGFLEGMRMQSRDDLLTKEIFKDIEV